MTQPRGGAEPATLLRWLADDHFTFLGYREYDLVRPTTASACGPCPAPGSASCGTTGRAATRCASCRPGRAPGPKDPDEQLVLAKANSRATVHRANYLDYVAVKKFDADGEVVGEHRFLGLYTHAAHTESIAGIPVLRASWPGAGGGRAAR